jgi:hypothetical protein
MKKRTNLMKLATMGIASGILITNGQLHGHQFTADTMNSSTQASSNKMMTESELMSKLNDEGKAIYQGLSQEGKEMAIKMASQTCKGKNECKGMNSCKSDKNACLGQGGCKGTSKGPFTDKNDAVKLAQKKMADKRSNMMNDSK